MLSMEKEPIIEFVDVKKEYFLYKNEKARFKAIFTKNKGVKKHPALKGVSFKIYPGESVGIIGKNGAGKSTILKMITGVSFPNSGQIIVRGKVAALLELTCHHRPKDCRTASANDRDFRHRKEFVPCCCLP